MTLSSQPLCFSRDRCLLLGVFYSESGIVPSPHVRGWYHPWLLSVPNLLQQTITKSSQMYILSIFRILCLAWLFTFPQSLVHSYLGVAPYWFFGPVSHCSQWSMQCTIVSLSSNFSSSQKNIKTLLIICCFYSIGYFKIWSSLHFPFQYPPFSLQTYAMLQNHLFPKLTISSYLKSLMWVTDFTYDTVLPYPNTLHLGNSYLSCRSTGFHPEARDDSPFIWASASSSSINSFLYFPYSYHLNNLFPH